MTADLLRERAERLRQLHRPGRPLVLVNAWDAASARLVAEAGAPAIATSSAGIAFAAGLPDGEEISRDRMLTAVAAICAAVDIPVTADVEAGYGDSPEDARRTAAGVLDAGAVGVNLEDGTDQPEAPLADLPRQVEKIRAVVAEGRRRGVPLVVNARTDVFLDRVGPESGRLDEAVRRGAAYRDAGADCVFVPGVTDRRIIAGLVERLGCPVNVLAVAGSPPVAELAALGVARVSLGSGPMRAAVTLVRRMAEETLGRGTYSFLEGIASHAELNALFSKRGSA